MQSEALPQVSSNGEEGASQKDREAEAERACMEVLWEVHLGFMQYVCALLALSIL